MRRSLILALCVVLCGALVAQADTIDFNKTTDGTTYTTLSNVLSFTRTYDGDLDLDVIDIFVNDSTAWSGDSTMGLGALEGVWDAVNGKFALIQKKGTYTRSWFRYTDNTYTPTYNEMGFAGSWVNLPYNSGATFYETVDGTIGVNSTVTGTNGYSLATELKGSWFTASSDDYIFSEGQLARFYVTTGADVMFTAAKGNYVNLTDGVSFLKTSASSNMGGWFSTQVPEPSTILLTVSGLVGLLCYAWRKRR